MRYFKFITDGIIDSIGTGNGGEEITESEYNEILAVIASKQKRKGYGYSLKEDLTWEEYKIEDDPDPDINEIEAFELLFGGVV